MKTFIWAWMPMIAWWVAAIPTALGQPAAKPTIANQPVDLSPPPPSVPTVAVGTNRDAKPESEGTSPAAEARSDAAGDEAVSEAAPNVGPAKRVSSKESLPIKGPRLDRTLPARKQPEASLKGQGGFAQGVIALGAVLALIVILAYAARRWVPGMRPLRATGLEVLGRTQLSPKQSIAVVRLGGRLVLVGITPDRISQLAIVDDPQEVGALLADLRHGTPKGAGNQFFNPVFDEASNAYEENGMDDESELQGPGSADYEQARGQIRGLLSKVKMLTASRWAG